MLDKTAERRTWPSLSALEPNSIMSDQATAAAASTATPPLLTASMRHTNATAVTTTTTNAVALLTPLTLSQKRSHSHNQLISPLQRQQQQKQSEARAKLSPLKLEAMPPASLVHGAARRPISSATIMASLPPMHPTSFSSRRGSIAGSIATQSAPPPPPLMRTRRGSLILTATMKAMNHFVAIPTDDDSVLVMATTTTTTTTTAANTPSRAPRRSFLGLCDRRKSNQDSDGSDSDSDSDSDPHDALHLELTSPRDNNQREDATTPKPLGAPFSSSSSSRTSPPPPYFRLSTFLLEDHDNITTTPPSSSPSSPSPQAARRLSSSSTFASPRRTTMTTPCKATQIDSIFREIWQTEQSYVAALRGLVTQFFEPLQVFAKRNDIALGAMGALHHSTSTILSIHEELLRQLEPLHTPSGPSPSSSLEQKEMEATVAKQDPFGVGFTGTLARLHHLSRAFLSTIEYMKVYAFYCGSYLSAKQELERLQRQHPRLAEFTAQLNECALRGSQSDDDCDGDGLAKGRGGRLDPPVQVPPLDINSTLIKPVQRICRYPLLFKSLLSNATGPEETLVLQQSLQKIEAVSTYVNEKVRESQNNARLYQLHQMMDPSSHLELLQPSRTLLYEAWANVTSLDAPRWPAKLLRHFRRRRSGRHKRRCSSVQALAQTQAPRDDWLRMSVFGGDDRRTSATVTAKILKSHASVGSGLGSYGRSVAGDSNRHTSFSSASQANAPLCIPPPGGLQRRRSSGGERARLILLSDMLLMAKLREQQLKIRRQICLSCAVIHDEDDDNRAAAQAAARDGGGGDDPAEAAAASEENELLPPCIATAAVVALEQTTTSESFTLEVSKVGHCACHQFTPLTLRRSPRLGSLSTFLTGRRSSISFAASSPTAAAASATGDLFSSNALQRHELQHADSGGSNPDTTLARTQSSQSNRFRAVSKSGSRFRYLEQLAGIRTVKRYRVTCDSVQEKAKFLKALRDAMARSARLVSLGGRGTSTSALNELTSDSGTSRGTSTSGSSSSSSSSSADRVKAVAVLAVTLPARIWRSLRSSSDATACGSARSSGGVLTATAQSTTAGTTSSSSRGPAAPRRRRSSLASVRNLRITTNEGDLLQLDGEDESDAAKQTVAPALL